MTMAKTSIFEVAPNHSTVRQRLSLGEGSAQRPGLCFPFGGDLESRWHSLIDDPRFKS